MSLSKANRFAHLSSDRQLAAVIGKNTVFSLASNAAQIGSRFVMIPAVVFHLGLGGYGIWSIIMATAAYMRFGRYGLKSAFQKYVAEATATGDYDRANKLLSTGSISMLGLSIIVLIPVAVFARKLAAISGVPSEFLSAATRSITLLALIMAASNFGSAFEAVVLGGHRADLVGKLSMASTVGEAAVIVGLLRLGHGLFAMSLTIALSELLFVSSCYVASLKIVPEIRIRLRHFTHTVSGELIRFAGSYQLVNLLEVLYALLLPVTILKYFGAQISGVYALATRLVTAGLMVQDALILPILSGGALILASGQSERISRFFGKAFKATVASSLAPLAFLAAFGSLIIFGWTGQSGPEFRMTMWLCCICGLFQAISRLQLILYRASGKALQDNLRQGFRLAVLVVLAFVGGPLGYYGVLTGLIFGELAGVLFMFFVMHREMPEFSVSRLVPDTFRVTAATTLVIAGGLAMTLLPTPIGAGERVTATVRLGIVSLGCLIAAFPAIVLTRSISPEEQRTILEVLLPRRKAVLGQD
jgi:O-antigen/teichoic acid export membrane protein